MLNISKPKNIFKKYDEVTEDIFDMSNMRYFKDIERDKKRGGGGVYTLLRLWSAEFCKAFDLRNLCYSKISVVMLLEYRIAEVM